MTPPYFRKALNSIFGITWPRARRRRRKFGLFEPGIMISKGETASKHWFFRASGAQKHWKCVGFGSGFRSIQYDPPPLGLARILLEGGGGIQNGIAWCDRLVPGNLPRRGQIGRIEGCVTDKHHSVDNSNENTVNLFWNDQEAAMLKSHKSE